jgi:hypothetical protein
LFQDAALFPVFELVTDCLIYLKPNQILNEIMGQLLLDSFDPLDMMLIKSFFFYFVLEFLQCGMKLSQANLLSCQALLGYVV